MLSACPKCQRLIPRDEGFFCPADGTRLLSLAEVSQPRDPEDPLVGATIAERYEIRRMVADGGMGRVYEARVIGDEHRVALKILHADIAEDDVNIERFRREASTSRDLSHPHVVEVRDFSTIPSLPGRKGAGWFLVMEFLDGEELRGVLKRDKTLTAPRVLRLISQLALALDSAHGRGFVHRDLKPDNIFLVCSPEGDRVKLLDFGSVKFTKGQDKGNKLTVMGTTIGSPYYMSPEQAQGAQDLDHRADGWAVGVIIYECMVGKVPFHANNGPQILFKIIGDEPMPPSFANEQCPSQLDDFAAHSLKKKPSDRYQSVGELADALGHAFGLSGDHHHWAYTPEMELHRLIEGPRAKSERPPAAEAAESPPVVVAPVPQPSPERSAEVYVEAPSRSPATTTLDEVNALPVKKTPPWVWAAMAVGVLLLLGVVAKLAS